VGGLARRVSVRHDPELDRGYPDGRPAVVVVRLHDGRAFEAAATRPRGDGPAALDDVTVRDKPRRLLASRLGAEGAQAVLAAVDRLADDGLGPLSAALRAPR
jgi:2-methylcitrate dehydratase PrpD